MSIFDYFTFFFLTRYDLGFYVFSIDIVVFLIISIPARNNWTKIQITHS